LNIINKKTKQLHYLAWKSMRYDEEENGTYYYMFRIVVVVTEKRPRGSVIVYNVRTMNELIVFKSLSDLCIH
jgi:hypothetical protein